MTQNEAKVKDQILQYLVDNGGTKQFNYCDEISSTLEIEKHTISTYCEDIGYVGLVIFNKNLQGCDVKLTDRGEEFINSGGHTKEYELGKQNQLEEQSIRKDEALSRKVTRRSARGSIFLSLAAIIIAIVSILAQFFGWFRDAQ